MFLENALYLKRDSVISVSKELTFSELPSCHLSRCDRECELWAAASRAAVPSQMAKGRTRLMNSLVWTLHSFPWPRGYFR